MRVLRRTLPMIASIALLGLPASAGAQSNPVLADCRSDSTLDGNYTREQLLDARGQLSAEDDYNDCFEAINSALNRNPNEKRDRGGPGGAGAAGGGSGGNGAQVPSAPRSDPAEEAAEARGALEDLTNTAAPQVDIGGRNVTPGSFNLAEGVNDLPLPVLLSLIALALAMVGTLAFAFRERLRALPLPSIGRVSPLRLFRR